MADALEVEAGVAIHSCASSTVPCMSGRGIGSRAQPSMNVPRPYRQHDRILPSADHAL